MFVSWAILCINIHNWSEDTVWAIYRSQTRYVWLISSSQHLIIFKSVLVIHFFIFWFCLRSFRDKKDSFSVHLKKGNIMQAMPLKFRLRQTFICEFMKINVNAINCWLVDCVFATCCWKMHNMLLYETLWDQKYSLRHSHRFTQMHVGQRVGLLA